MTLESFARTSIRAAMKLPGLILADMKGAQWTYFNEKGDDVNFTATWLTKQRIELKVDYVDEYAVRPGVLALRVMTSRQFAQANHWMQEFASEPFKNDVTWGNLVRFVESKVPGLQRNLHLSRFYLPGTGVEVMREGELATLHVGGKLCAAGTYSAIAGAFQQAVDAVRSPDPDTTPIADPSPLKGLFK